MSDINRESSADCSVSVDRHPSGCQIVTFFRMICSTDTRSPGSGQPTDRSFSGSESIQPREILRKGGDQLSTGVSIGLSHGERPVSYLPICLPRVTTRPVNCVVWLIRSQNAESVALRLNLEWAYVYHVHFPSWLNGKALLAPPDRNSRNEVCISPVKGRLVKGSIQ